VTLRIEDYGIIGDTHTAALVGVDGSIDWLCVPRFDSQACFAKLLGTPDNGYWKIAPKSGIRSCKRQYLGDTMVLQSEFETDTGVVRLVDCMPLREQYPEVVRWVEGVTGSVEMRMELVVRFDYGKTVPWVTQKDGQNRFIAGPDALCLWSPVHTRGEDLKTVAEFTLQPGQSVPFLLSWHPSHAALPRPVDARFIVDETERWWQRWADACTYEGEWRDTVVRSILTIKALSYEPTGGIVAAATTSLPEDLGGVRNWDYRYCWLRDATLCLTSLMFAGYYDEARDWRDWLLRAVAGDPKDLQIMYGPAGERRLDEYTLDWLPGYENSRPVRVGNAAAGQYQLDVYGEVMAALHQARAGGMEGDPAWDLERILLEFVETGWREPDDGIWEVRGPRRHFTHSKVMAWVAFDRGVRAIEEFGFDGPLDRWKKIRQEIHDEVCEKGYDPKKGAFTQYYGSEGLDASILMVPLVGFLPATDERMSNTVAAIQRELMRDGFVMRYQPTGPDSVDGLPGEEGAFLACSFWLVDNLGLLGRKDEACEMFERLIGLRNDLGLLSEEYDPRYGRLVGNFPQAFSHVSLVNSAVYLSMGLTAAEAPRMSRMRVRRRRHRRQ